MNRSMVFISYAAENEQNIWNGSRCMSLKFIFRLVPFTKYDSGGRDLQIRTLLSLSDKKYDTSYAIKSTL